MQREALFCYVTRVTLRDEPEKVNRLEQVGWSLPASHVNTATVLIASHIGIDCTAKEVASYGAEGNQSLIMQRRWSDLK